jgi:ArsR family transcriptional regulator
MSLEQLIPISEVAACCTPLVGEAIDEKNAAALAGALKALGDPTRLRLLSLVAAHKDGEVCVCDLTEEVGLQQSTISHHLKILVDAGYLTRDKRGTWGYYRLVPGSLDSVAKLLSKV